MTAPEPAKTIDWAKWKDIAATLQSCVVIAGIIAGGIWSLNLFSETKQREIAEAQLANVRQQMETLDLNNKKQNLKRVTLQLEQLRTPSGKPILAAKAFAENKDSTNWDIDFAKSYIFITDLGEKSEDGRATMGSFQWRRTLAQLHSDDVFSTSYSLLPGGGNRYVAYVVVPHPGFYAVRAAIGRTFDGGTIEIK
jgi:hypothetical protein